MRIFLEPERTAQLVSNELQDHQMTRSVIYLFIYLFIYFGGGISTFSSSSEQAGRQIEQKRNAIADAQRRINDLEAQVNGLRSDKVHEKRRKCFNL